MEVDRNPSPPPEFLQNGELVPDRIGNTLYSKKFCYKTLMEIIQFNDTSSNCNMVPPDETAEHVADGSEMVELDLKIEEDACSLWDMSANEEVTSFLVEIDVPNMCLDIIYKTKSPRLLEIIIGILGNMSSFNAGCENISNIQNLVDFIISLSGTSDTPTLLQVFRLVHCGISNEKFSSIWFEQFEKDDYFMENLKFTLQNSLNGTVLIGVLRLIQSILTKSTKYCVWWGDDSKIAALVSAAKQSLKCHDALDYFFFVLDALCQHSPNMDQLGKHMNELNPIFSTYFESLVEDEALPEETRISAILSSFELYNIFLKTEYLKKDILSSDVTTLKSISKFYTLVGGLISNVRENNSEVVDIRLPVMGRSGDVLLSKTKEVNGAQCTNVLTQEEFHLWTDLSDVILDIAKSLLIYFEEGSERNILENILYSDHSIMSDVTST